MRPSKRLTITVIAMLVLALPTIAFATNAARISRPKVSEFFVATAPGVGCFIVAEAGGGTVVCYTETRSFEQKATLSVSGEVQVCARHVHAFADDCELGNAGEGTPTFKAGKRIVLGAFRCQVVRYGVSCTVIATGKGFYMTAHHVTSVGGAAIVPAPLRIPQFLSPDRSVWCVMEDRTCGTYPKPPTRSAEIDSQGNDTFCNVPELITPPGANEAEGCFQNWNSSAPVLAYGHSDLYNGLLCMSAADGITCTLDSGAGEGKGFRIDKSEMVEVG
jgi:hypothetical protein